MRNDGLEARVVRHGDGGERLAQRANLVDLDEDGVRSLHVDALLEALRVRHEEVVADDLQTVAELLRDQLPALPILFIKRIFEGDDRILVDELLPMLDELCRREDLAGLGLLVLALLRALPLAGCCVHREHEILAGLVA